MPDLYDSGTLHVTLTPFPDSIALTIEEALRVLYDFKHGNITQQELDEAKVPYLGTVHLSPKRATCIIRHLESGDAAAPSHRGFLGTKKEDNTLLSRARSLSRSLRHTDGGCLYFR